MYMEFYLEHTRYCFKGVGSTMKVLWVVKFMQFGHFLNFMVLNHSAQTLSLF